MLLKHLFVIQKLSSLHRYSFDAHQQQTAFENIMGKGEMACNKNFPLFAQCFLLNQTIVSPFVHIFDIISLFAAEFEEPKIGISDKGLIWSTPFGFTQNTLHDFQNTVLPVT